MFSVDVSNTKNEIRQDGIFGLGIDAGGTFTDAVIYDLSGKKLLAKNKTLTTKWDYTEGIERALNGLDPALLTSVNLVALSTTLATNAIVEGKGQKVGLLFMPPYGLFEPEDIPHEPKALISGRLEITGEQIEPVDEREVVRVAQRMVREHKVKAFAVSGYAGVINPDHELTVKRILEKETGLNVSCGHELSDILNFRTRANTAVMNGRIIPLLTRLLSDTREVLQRFKIHAPVVVVRGDGTLMRSEVALKRPVETILSGPAASVAGARHLTGKQNALVVDIGGTTTDVAMLRDGRVETNDSGSYVGENKTHVRALRIRTLGLGGDSFIAWNRGRFAIGPQRVVSMAWLGAHVPGSDRALDYIREHRNGFGSDSRRLQLLMHQGGRDKLPLTEQEKEILDLLEERAYGFQELAERIGMAYWNPQIIRRLETHHLVQRCGITPTDVFNFSGDLALWDAGTSKRMCEILGGAIGKSPAQMIGELKREMIERFALVVLKRLLDDSVDPEGMEDCEVCRELVDNIFGRKQRTYNLRLETQPPIVGIGAPVHLFLPGAAALLGAASILPEHADVANAVGAVTSKVVVRRKAEIRAYRNRFRIEGLPGARQFDNFEKAKAWAEENLTRLVREIARASGAAETEVAVVAKNMVHTMPSGKPLFMGCSLSAELKGTPVFRFEGRPELGDTV